MLMDQHGHPTVWEVRDTYGFSDWETIKIFIDANRDGRAELVTSTCEYDSPWGEVRRLTGIYEARDGKFIPLNHVDQTPYRDAVGAHYDSVRWLPVSSEWPDLVSEPAPVSGN